MDRYKLIVISCMLHWTLLNLTYGQQHGQRYVYEGEDPQPYLPNNGRYDGDLDYYGYGGDDQQYNGQQEVTCDQRNSCRGRDPYWNPRQVNTINCFCDDRCQIYDDCCSDFIQTSSNHFYENFKLPRNVFTCRMVNGVDEFSPVYVVDSCPKNYTYQYTKRLCERGNIQDVFTSVPVSGSLSGILYKNFYCSICNGEDNYSFWSIDVQCDSEQKEINATADNFTVDRAITTLLSSPSHNCSLVFEKEGVDPRFCKENVISKCSNGWKDKQVKRQCRGYKKTSHRYLLQHIFRNEFCAQCNSINVPDLGCIDQITPVTDLEDVDISKHYKPPFSLLLDVNIGSGRLKELKVGIIREEWVTTSVVTRQCETNHIYDPFARRCRLVHCVQGQVFRGGFCVPDGVENITVQTTTVNVQPTPEGGINGNGIPTLRTPATVPNPHLRPGTDPMVTIKRNSENSNILKTGSVTPASGTVKDFEIIPLNCPMILLQLSEYYRAGDIVYVPLYDRYFNTSEYFNSTNGDILICAPSVESNYSVTVNETHRLEMFKFDRIQGLVSYIGLLISIICLFVVFVIYMIFPVLRNIPGKCVICLVVSLLLAQVSFMLGGPLVDFRIACFTLAVLVHLFYLCTFCWINVLSVDIFRMISSSNTRSEEDSTCFIYYSLYAWLTPLVIVGATLAIDFLGDDISEFKPMYGDGICWITQRWALLITFAAPVALIIVINLIIYVITTVKICLISRAARYLHTDKKDKNLFLLCIKLCLIMGLTWVFGFVAAMTELWFMWYLFIVFNTLQGAFICFAFVCNRNVFGLLKGNDKKKKVVASSPYYGNANVSNSWNRTKNTVLDTSYNGDARVIESRETCI